MATKQLTGNMTREEIAKARMSLREMKIRRYIKENPVKAGLIGAGVMAAPLAVGYAYNRLSGHPAYGHDKVAEHCESAIVSNKYLVKIAQMQKMAADQEKEPYNLMHGSLGVVGAGVSFKGGKRASGYFGKDLANAADNVSSDTVRKFTDAHDMRKVNIHGYSDRLTSSLPAEMVGGGRRSILDAFSGDMEDLQGPHHNSITGRVSAGHPMTLHAPDSGAVLLHELSHADFHNKLKKTGLALPYMLGRHPKVMAGGGVVGGAMIGSDENSKYAAGVNAATYLPTLVDEGQANLRAYNHIRKFQPDALAGGNVRKAVVGSMASYLAPAVTTTGALYGMHKIKHYGENS